MFTIQSLLACRKVYYINYKRFLHKVYAKMKDREDLHVFLKSGAFTVDIPA